MALDAPEGVEAKADGPMTHEKQHNGSKVVKWFVDKILPWVLMGVIGFGFEMLTWRIQVNDEIKHLHEEVIALETFVDKMKDRMDVALSTEAAGHVTHREANITKRETERRLEILTQFHVREISRLPPEPAKDDKPNQ